ncbi:MAG: hypothetical protein JSU65_08830, partial [Candidatus Zixiibacteriota bacterium]
IWSSAGRITEWGYVVELSIPFNQLRFQRTDGPQVWGFDAVRSYPRNQRHHIGLFPRDRSNNCYLCQAVKIEGFEGASPGKNIELAPTVTGVRTDSRADWPEGGFSNEREDADVGVTATWGMTPNLTLTTAVNPDFSQVEADAFQLDVNQPFALYYGERRPFFTEGSDFFETLKDVVYTRAMRDPEWGIKLSGKEGSNTIGLYAVRDRLTNLIFPGSYGSYEASLDKPSTAVVARYKRDLGSRFTLGTYVTNREGEDYYNRLIGLDADLRLTRTDQVQMQLLGSSTKYPHEVALDYSQEGGRFNDGFIAFEYDHNTRSLSWWLDYDEIGPGFRADLGFIPQVGIRNVEGGVYHNWNSPPGSWWARILAGFELNYYEDKNRTPIERGGEVWFQYSGIFESDLYLEVSQSDELYSGKTFDLTSVYAQGSIRPSASINTGLSITVGDRIDYDNVRKGSRFQIRPWMTHRLGRHIRLELVHRFERMSVDAGRLYTANVSYLEAIYHFSSRALLRSIVQYVHYDYNPAAYTFKKDPQYKRLSSQWLFSYKINPRTVLYFGYSDNHYGAANGNLVQYDRTLFAKLGYAWIL